jgi:hypothetical protein
LILYTLCSFTWSFSQQLLSAEILAQPFTTDLGAKGGGGYMLARDVIFGVKHPKSIYTHPLHLSRCISHFKVREDTKSEHRQMLDRSYVCPLSVCVPTYNSSHQCQYVRRSRLCGHPTTHRVHRKTASELNYTAGWLLKSGLVWEIMIYISTRIKGQQELSWHYGVFYLIEIFWIISG